MRVLVLVCGLGLCGQGLWGCAPCGSFQGPAGLPDGEESCGNDNGTSGIFADDGTVVIAVQPDPTGNVFSDSDTFAFSDMLVTFVFPKAELVENTTVTHVGGNAFRGLGGQHTDEAALTHATVKVGKFKGKRDPDSVVPQSTWELEWDVTWGNGLYHATGHDDVDIGF